MSSLRDPGEQESSIPKSKDPTDATRVRSFVIYFKNYMSLASIVVACLPIPITEADILPTISGQQSALSVFTSLFCFLLLAFIFYSRHALARFMFPEEIKTARIEKSLAWMSTPKPHAILLVAALPLLLVVATAGFAFLYCLNFFSRPYLDPTVIGGLYVGMFASAESAFVLMATKEYVQDLLGYTDKEIILGPGAPESLLRLPTGVERGPVAQSLEELLIESTEVSQGR